MVLRSRAPGAGDWSVSDGWTPNGWAIWQLPVRVVLLVLGVETAALALLLGAAGHGFVDGSQVGSACLLVLLGVVHTELATGIERARRRAADAASFDLNSVWTFAAALLLPAVPAAAVIVAVYLHLWQRVWRPARIPLHRLVYTVATVFLAAGAAHAVVCMGVPPVRTGDPVAMVAIAAAVVVYVAINQLLVVGAVALGDERPAVRELVGRWDDHAVELATLCMGALTAAALASTPALVVLVLPPILVLHRAALVRQLEQAVFTDAKTGLLSMSGWQARAEEAIRRASRERAAVAVLILDLDHFKAINDGYGHLAGDRVLAAVADELRGGVRQHDLVGRFGGEEFVVLLPGLPAGPTGRAELAAVAERLRGRIADLAVTVPDREPGRPGGEPSGTPTISGLSVSVGGAAAPADGQDLEQMMRAADASLYAAKRAGRNLVRIAAGTDVPAPRRRSA